MLNEKQKTWINKQLCDLEEKFSNVPLDDEQWEQLTIDMSKLYKLSHDNNDVKNVIYMFTEYMKYKDKIAKELTII